MQSSNMVILPIIGCRCADLRLTIGSSGTGQRYLKLKHNAGKGLQSYAENIIIKRAEGVE